MIKRRGLLAAGGAVLAAPSIAAAQGSRVLKFAPQANVSTLDPIWTTQTIARNHGYMVYDVLYGSDEELQPQPQMAEGHVVEDDGKRWVITLRSGLKFHDGEPVRAADCVQSLKRWMKRSPWGGKLEPVLDELSADGDRKIVFRLKRPFPLLLHAIGTAGSPVPFIMPERVAQTDPFQQIREATGSGPWKFKADEYLSGSRIVYERFGDYRPTPVGTPSLTAGPKLVHFDRSEWLILPDAATAAAALQTGEIDWYEQPPPEIQQLLKRDRNITIDVVDPKGSIGILRFNWLHSPFDNKALRRAILPAVSQEDYMISIVGPDPSGWKADVGVFTPGFPMATTEALGPLQGPRSVERAKALMKEAGYTNQLMRILVPTDILAPAAISQVAVDMFRRLGFNMDAVTADWGTVVQRRASREPLDKGGWSVVLTTFPSFDFADPAAHYLVRGNGANAWFGWPTIPKLEELRDAWFEASDAAEQKRLCVEIQRTIMDEVPYIPVGAYLTNTAHRANLRDRVKGFAIMWNVRRV